MRRRLWESGSIEPSPEWAPLRGPGWQAKQGGGSAVLRGENGPGRVSSVMVLSYKPQSKTPGIFLVLMGARVPQSMPALQALPPEPSASWPLNSRIRE